MLSVMDELLQLIQAFDKANTNKNNAKGTNNAQEQM